MRLRAPLQAEELLLLGVELLLRENPALQEARQLLDLVGGGERRGSLRNGDRLRSMRRPYILLTPRGNRWTYCSRLSQVCSSRIRWVAHSCSVARLSVSGRGVCSNGVSWRLAEANASHERRG